MKTKIRGFALPVAVLLATSASAAYRCVDEKGFTRIGDTPPEQCAKVVMFEVTSSGTVLRRIEPSLTPEQVRARAEVEERRKEADKVANEQKRKDLALLATYSAEGEFDTVRERTVGPLRGRIKNANDRMVAVEKRLKELEEEMEFYKAGKSKGRDKDGKEKPAPQAPPMLVGEMHRLKSERDTITRNLAGFDREIAVIQAKSEVDKKRWLALKSGTADAPPAAVADAKPDAKAESKAPAKADSKPAARKVN